jgi:hypothetical protein
MGARKEHRGHVDMRDEPRRKPICRNGDSLLTAQTVQCDRVRARMMSSPNGPV